MDKIKHPKLIVVSDQLHIRLKARSKKEGMMLTELVDTILKEWFANNPKN